MSSFNLDESSNTRKKESQLTTEAKERILHVRYKGESRDVPISELDCDITSDTAIKNAVASFLDLGDQHDLGDYVLVRHKNENMTLRPEAVFGAVQSS